MPTTDPFKDRVRMRNDRKQAPGEYVLYWMQQSQRAEDNLALEYAVELANDCNTPLCVVFGLTDDYPDANLRHYQFMLEGLAEVQATLSERGIPLTIRHGSPPDVALESAQKACAVVCDRGYLRHQRNWRREAAQKAPCPLFEVEADVVVPVQTVSDKAEYAARTIRPKIHRELDTFLKTVYARKLNKAGDGSKMLPGGIDLSDIDAVLEKMKIDRRVAPVGRFFKGGTTEAKRRFADFVKNRLSCYAENSNQPQTDDVSAMSPYLHFGQISPHYLAAGARKKRSSHTAAVDAYLEELIVRRELAVNFVFFNDRYDRFDCLPQWAQKTLSDHAGDKRDPGYDRKTLEAAARSKAGRAIRAVLTSPLENMGQLRALDAHARQPQRLG